MGDIADILGVQKGPELTDGQQATKIMEGAPGVGRPVKIKKPKGMSREVYDLVGPAGLLPAMETKQPLASGFKQKRVSATKGKWIWAPFNSTARSDNQAFYHWAKADVQFNDYPYTKYNIKLTDNLNPAYSDHEYNSLLQTRGWTRSETDMLMHLCHKYDLRWPVIVDRYQGVPPRSLEELQARYLTVQHKLKQSRATRHNPREISIGIDIRAERNRRTLQDYVIRRSKEEEEEIVKLKESLKTVEATLRKHKQLPAAAPKAGVGGAVKQAKGNKNASAAEPVGLAARKGARGASSSGFSSSFYSHGGVGSGVPSADESATFEPEALTLVPGKPTLQSLRIPVPDQKTNISKTLLKKMTSLLRDLGVPEAPIATRASLDFLDSVRQSAVALLSIQSAIARKEKELGALQAKMREAAQGVVSTTSASVSGSTSGGGGGGSNSSSSSSSSSNSSSSSGGSSGAAGGVPTSVAGTIPHITGAGMPAVPAGANTDAQAPGQSQAQRQAQGQGQGQVPPGPPVPPPIKTEPASSEGVAIAGVGAAAAAAGPEKRPLDTASAEDGMSPKRRRAGRD
jgi:DNA methyltransferase 1-associated protein 1